AGSVAAAVSARSAARVHSALSLPGAVTHTPGFCGSSASGSMKPLGAVAVKLAKVGFWLTDTVRWARSLTVRRLSATTQWSGFFGRPSLAAMSATQASAAGSVSGTTTVMGVWGEGALP